MKVKFISTIFILVFFMCSCDELSNRNTSNTTQQFYSDNNQDEKENEPDPEPEKKSNIFYEKLLERFCEDNYSSCFNGREFINKSLVVNIVDYSPRIDENGKVVRYDGNVRGIHSFKGRLGKTYSDYHFEAYVSEQEEGYYRIYFKKESWHPIDGRVMDEDATRTMYYTE